MKERPILFSAPMVRALRTCEKSQTRRVVKPQPSQSSDTAFVGEDGIWRFSHPTLRGPVSHDADDVRCPYGQPGDRLWVREAFFDATKLNERRVIYRADGDQSRFGFTPSIHMPRWASRITLEITGVRVERLQDISEADAIAEGIEPFTDFQPTGHWKRYRDGGLNSYVDNPIASYASLWTEINGAGSWEMNPWVWVIDFQEVVHAGA